MFIQTLLTPNPNSLKFLVEGEACQPGKTYECTLVEFIDPDNHSIKFPFMERIFNIKGVKRIYISEDFVTITKDENTDWALIKPSILESIMEFSMQKSALIPYSEDGEGSEDDSGDDDIDISKLSEIEKEIVELIKDRIRPAVAMDGGDVRFKKFDDTTGILYLEMRGACSGCPSASVTLKDGIKRMLQFYIPEVLDVEEYIESGSGASNDSAQPSETESSSGTPSAPEAQSSGSEFAPEGQSDAGPE